MTNEPDAHRLGKFSLRVALHLWITYKLVDDYNRIESGIHFGMAFVGMVIKYKEVLRESRRRCSEEKENEPRQRG